MPRSRPLESLHNYQDVYRSVLMEATRRSMNASYVTKNSAPRNAFLSLLSQGRAADRLTIEHMFRSPFGLANCACNQYDCLIVDEAHRLVKKMYGDWNGENQVKECNGSGCSAAG